MRVGVITGSRADLSGILEVQAALQRHGHEVLGYRIDEPNIDNIAYIAGKAGSAAASVALWCRNCELDLMVVCGDRTEVLGAAFGAHMARVPVAHIAGGDLTIGSADNATRNAITALSALHFATNIDALSRLINTLGVPGNRCHFTGSPAVDRLLRHKRVSRETAFRAINAPVRLLALMVSVHPETMPSAPDTCGAVLRAVDKVQAAFSGQLSVLLTTPNKDTGFSAVQSKLQHFALGGSVLARTLLPNLPPDQFISVLANCDAMVGNSSAGVYEAPVLGIPSVVVGDRQRGRPRTAYLYASADHDECDEIEGSLRVVLRKPPVNPCTVFGTGNAAEQIATTIDGIKDPKRLLEWR